MLIEFAMRVGSFVQRECTRHVNLKRTGFDQAIELLDLLRSGFDIVALDIDARRRFWWRHHAIRISDPSILAHSVQGTIDSFATGSDECSIQTAGSKCPRSGFDIVLAAIHDGFRTETF